MSVKKPRVGRRGAEEYDSDFDEDGDDDEVRHKKVQRQDLATSSQPGCSKQVSTSNHASGLPSKSYFETERGRADGYKYSYLSLNAFERHRKLINEYFLYYPGSKNLLQRDSSKDKTDSDIVRDNHRFIWGDEDDPNTWEKQLSKKYYDKLFKEYCICDLSFYQQGKYAMRWRTETEVVNGKGQFTCGARKCNNSEDLRSWEVNFAYMEESVKKNALVKLRLCPECSTKLNYHQQRKDVTRTPKKKKKKAKRNRKGKEGGANVESTQSTGHIEAIPQTEKVADTTIWKDSVQLTDIKTRDEEFDEYLDDLLL